jgi:hypothetical protein
MRQNLSNPCALCIISACLLVAQAASAPATLSKTADETRANTATSGDQRGWIYSKQYVAVTPNGESIVTYGSASGDGSGFRVLFQRFDADANPVGGETQVNETTTGEQYLPTVAADSSGNFVIVWQGEGPGDSEGIFARRYDSSGSPLSGEFRVNTYTTNTQSWTSIAMRASGEFVVTWGSNGQDGDLRGIYAQRYNAAGVAQGSEFRVNQTTTGEQNAPMAAMDSSGNFVIAWDSPSIGDDVYIRRYDAAGSALSGETMINSSTANDQDFAAIAMNSSGDFVVVWTHEVDAAGTDTSIMAQRFNASGVAQGSNFQVNTYTTARQIYPMVAMDDSGAFIVTWESEGQDGGTKGVYAQRYDAGGTKIGCEFRLNTYSSVTQEIATVATNASGSRVVAAWVSNGQDGSGKGVYTQLLQPLAVHPPTQTLCESGTAVFEVRTLETGLSYQWRRNGVDIPLENGPTLSLAGVTAAQADGYDCVVTTSCPVSTDLTATTGTLTVNTAATYDSQPGNLTVTEGDPVVFTAPASGTGPISHQWKKGLDDVVDGGTISGAQTDTLQISSAAMGDAGDYTCEITNVCAITPVVSDTVTLTVNAGVNEWLLY